MRLFFNIILILLAILACYLEDIYLHFWPPQPGQAVYLTIRSHQSFSFNQQEALEENRQKALSRYVPVYRYIPPEINASKAKFEDFRQEVAAFKDKKQNGVEGLRIQLETKFGVALSPTDIISMVKYRDLKNLLEGILTIEESILQNKILGDSQHLADKKTIEIKSPNSEGTVTHPVDDLITIGKARFLAEEKVRQLFWQVNKAVLDPVLRICLTTLQPNLTYDQKENDRRLDKINREFPSRIVAYKPGDVLVPFRKVLNDKDILLLNAYQQQVVAGIYREVPWVVFTILFMVVFYNLFLTKILRNGFRNEPPYRFLLSLLITTLLILKGYLVLIAFPIYGLPFCLLPMLIIFLNHGKITATATTLVGAMLVSLFTGPTYNILIFFTFGGLAAVLVSSGLRKRLQIIVPSLLVGFINTLCIIVFTLDWQAIVSQLAPIQSINFPALVAIVDAALTVDIAWAVIGGLAAGPLALLLLPLLEIGWDTASTFKLNRYMDLNRPLMKELLSKAPGTYQHSMTVAYLAQSVGEAIGADTLLLRIGAYYHDVGKMMNPKFFIENQFNGENPHDVLEPRESARVIVNHVRHGMRIGQESGLPKVVVDLILQHHGTQLMEYFYNVAAKTYPKSTIQEEDFRYPGPKPQSVEAAILMVTDAVEAASRSLEDPNRKKFEKMVRLILVKRIVDGQFAECDLSSRDLSKIVRSLVDALEASFHSRIRYPWQEKKAPPKKTDWRIGTTSESNQEDRAFRP
ncbi:MAG: HDIG domain-containing protein [Deltaproteobacteria bacterium]|jgi:putative nucleotidyltransferase with HDIG domain|nr:HDIG domain-containing protein [Deltaproteobacteria bacterium]